MVNINNLFAGIMMFMVSWGLIYLLHPEVVSFADGFPTEIKIFVLMVWLSLEMLAGLAMPFLMIISSDYTNP